MKHSGNTILYMYHDGSKEDQYLNKGQWIDNDEYRYIC